jgi:hypothetical protein
MDRRRFMKDSAALGLAMGAARGPDPKLPRSERGAFWPGGARMVVSLSLQMEAGAQPERGASGPWGPLNTRYPNLATENGTSTVSKKGFRGCWRCTNGAR